MVDRGRVFVVWEEIRLDRSSTAHNTIIHHCRIIKPPAFWMSPPIPLLDFSPTCHLAEVSGASVLLPPPDFTTTSCLNTQKNSTHCFLSKPPHIHRHARARYNPANTHLENLQTIVALAFPHKTGSAVVCIYCYSLMSCSLYCSVLKKGHFVPMYKRQYII